LHVLTKILVVFGAILAVMLAGLSVAYTANTEQIVSNHKTLKSKITAADARVNELNQQSAAERESAQSQVSELRGTETQLRAEIASLQSSNSRLTADVETFKQSGSLHAAQIDQFLATSETYAGLNQTQSNELAQLRQKELENTRREIALTDRINELDGRLEVSLETNRSLQERLVEVREDLDFARQGGTQTAQHSDTGFLKAPINFRATVTDVRKDPAGSTLVEIDAGTSDNQIGRAHV